MTSALLVFLGGGLGSVVRMGLGNWLNSAGLLPLGTMIANGLACFLVGMGVGWIAFGTAGRWFWVTGFCGGFSTFSTYTLEGILLLEQGKYYLTAMYLLGSVVGGLTCTLFGLWVGRSLRL